MTERSQELVKKFLGSTRPFLVNGEWRTGSETDPLTVLNPSDGSVLGYAAQGTARDVDDAVRSARNAFESATWKRMPPSERTRLLWRLSELIEENADELLWLEVLNQGLPISVAREFVIPGVIETLRYYSGWCTKLTGSTSDVSLPDERPDSAIGKAFHAYTVHEPIGVVGAIIPWNFPLIMAAAKLAPALAAGCTIVLKPADETPFSALRLGELILEAGFPEGVVNIVPGVGNVVGAALASHPDVNKIAFTGSTATGKAIAQAATGNMKKVGLELGGKSPFIICADADIDAAIPGAAESIFLNTGQVCFAGSRLFVERSVVDCVVEGIASIANDMRIGPGADPETDMGPLISARQKDRVLNFFEDRDDRVEFVTGGTEVQRDGFYVAPTIALNKSHDTRLMREEVFGPVLSVMAFDSIDEVARLANDTDYGLAAGIWTSDLSKAHNLADEIKAGSVWVNCYSALDEAMTFGGFKQSGWGREGSRAGVEAFMESKSVVMAV